MLDLEAKNWVPLALTCFLLSTAPLAEAPGGKDLEEGNIRNLVHPKGVRYGAGHRQNGWRKSRRQRPRLSHKGPMPF
uniref:Apelin n=1 Tax=Pelusios castaneus TaxID=367368 RepID=A0A8C8VGJ6_9SAUR